MATLRTVISDLEDDEVSEAIESIDLASDEKVMSITFLRTIASAGTSTEPGQSEEDDPPPEEVLPEEVLPAEDAPAEEPPGDYPRAE